MLVQSSTNPLVYTATFTPDGSAANGTVRVDSNKFSDAAGNFNQDGLEANNAASLNITASAGKTAITLNPITGQDFNLFIRYLQTGASKDLLALPKSPH
jgi:hypothetical protein